MAIRPQEDIVAPDAVFTQTPLAPPTPQPDGKDRSAWNGWPSRNTAQPRVIIDDQERITRIRTPVLDLEGSLEYAWKEKQFTYLSSTYNFRLSDISANATAEYVLPFPVLKPHVGAGLGLHRIAYSVKTPQAPYPVPVPGDETKVGYHALVCVTFHPPLFPLEFFGDWRYTWVTTTGKQTRYSTLLAGVTLGLP